MTLRIHAASDDQQAYALWVNHSRRCPECLSAGRAESSPCQIGQNAWAVYAAARDGAEHPERFDDDA